MEYKDLNKDLLELKNLKSNTMHDVFDMYNIILLKKIYEKLEDIDVKLVKQEAKVEAIIKKEEIKTTVKK